MESGVAETRETNYRGVFDNRIGFGERPCVLVIDFIKAYTTKGAAFFGQGVVDAVEATVDLLAAARKAKVPIIYTKVLYHPSGMDGGLFVKKVPALRQLVVGEPLAEIDPRIPPAPEDLVIVYRIPQQSMEYYIDRPPMLIAFSGEYEFGIRLAPNPELYNPDPKELGRRLASKRRVFVVADKDDAALPASLPVPVRIVAQTTKRVLYENIPTP